ncbi:MAG: PEP-CTERM sorting domain-containing protein [Moorea sp. SIO3G5]|nr:PEP-CTERM sorting domain-containing protein [Moorena sp. SIO3G5]
MFKATPDSWTLDRDFGRALDRGGQTLTWNRESGITFNIGGTRGTDITYVDPNPNFTETVTNFTSNWVNVDPNPNFRETITNDPSKPDITSVPEPASGLALLGISALGAGSFLIKKDK